MPDKVAGALPRKPAALVDPGKNVQAQELTIPAKLCNLPPLHSIANQVLSLSADDNVDLPELAAVIEADPAFAAEILFLANSPLFGFPSKMHVLRHAVAVLGLDRIKALAVTVAMRAYLGQASPLIRQCWRHTAACAVIAEEISSNFDLAGDRAYTAALMHDIGRLGLLKSYAREVAPILAAPYNDAADALMAEHVAVNVDHGTAGAWLVKTWAFPAAFVEICEHHHEPLRPGDSPLLQVVKAACLMADALGYSAVRYRIPPSYGGLLASMLAHHGPERFPAEEALRNNVEGRLVAFEQ
ncbi:MAG TPA: HDOD domain-containing protein [Bryobacteraceae bacterium]|nr:HDOD domain-containing protein [Bryobacteraceae bacterium]